MTVMQAYEKFIEQKRSYCDASTVDWYIKNLKYFFEFLQQDLGSDIDAIELDQLDKKVLQRYVSYLRQKPKYEGHPFKIGAAKKGNLKNSTVRIYVRAVRGFFSWLEEDDDCSGLAVSRKVKLPKDDTAIQIPLYNFEVEKIDALYNPAPAAQTELDLRNLCIIHLMLDAGLRAEEVCALKVGHILFDKNMLSVVDSKNHKSRIVPLARQLHIYLRMYLHMRSSAADDVIGADTYLIVKIGSRKPIGYNVIKQMFYRIRCRTGLDRLHPHLLRHTFAISYLVGGGNLEYLRDMLGHSDYAVTRLYLRQAHQYRMMAADLYKLDSVFYQV